MEQIQLVDRGDYDRHFPLVYAALGAKKHWLSRQFPRRGIVVAYRCEDCGRLVLYGEEP